VEYGGTLTVSALRARRWIGRATCGYHILSRRIVEARGASFLAPSPTGDPVAKMRIYKQDGQPTPFFWREEDGKDRTQQTVYKRTADGVKRMKGVHYNVKTNEFEKEGA
jgi:hypothetical protein